MKKSRIWNQKKNGRKLQKFALKTEKITRLTTGARGASSNKFRTILIDFALY